MKILGNRLLISVDTTTQKTHQSGLIIPYDTNELEYMEGSKKIKVSKSQKGVISQNVSDNLVPSNKAVLSSSAENDGTRVKSPIIGTAYLAPEPGAKPFVKIGDKVKKGQTIMIVEAMKTMNHIPSSADGTVKKIMVNDGQPVEFGQTLIIID